MRHRCYALMLEGYQVEGKVQSGDRLLWQQEVAAGGHIASKPGRIPGDAGGGQTFKVRVSASQALSIYILYKRLFKLEAVVSI